MANEDELAECSRPGSVTIRSMLPDDVAQVVQIHLESFHGFFLTFLGPSFLALLYKCTLRDPDGIALVASSDERIEGFATGTLHQAGFYQRLVKKEKWRFALAASRAVLRQPTIGRRLLRALKRPAVAQQDLADACLMSLAVRLDSQHHGVGRQLVVAFCQELIRRGAPAVCLTTDRANNDRVNRFYQQLGFYVGQTFVTPEGRAINEYVTPLGEVEANPVPRKPAAVPGVSFRRAPLRSIKG